MNRLGRVGSHALAGALALFFVAVGGAKIGSSPWAAKFAAWGYPRWFALVVAAAEIGGGIALLVPRSRRPATVVLMIVMLGATVTHAVHAEWPRTVVTLALTALLAGMWALSRKPSRVRV